MGTEALLSDITPGNADAAALGAHFEKQGSGPSKFVPVSKLQGVRTPEGCFRQP